MTSILARFRAFRDKNGHGNGDVRQYAYKIRKDVYVYDSGSDVTLTSFKNRGIQGAGTGTHTVGKREENKKDNKIFHSRGKQGGK